METRPLGQTGLRLPLVSFGASSLGQEFRQIDLQERSGRFMSRSNAA